MVYLKGIKQFGLETPGHWKTWSTVPLVAFRRRKLVPLEPYSVDNSTGTNARLMSVPC